MDSDLDMKNIIKECGLNHIAIIMDGNRRWANSKNLPSALGHKAGVDSLKTVIKTCDEFGVKYLTVYAFSTENWNRKKEEVSFLMDLLAQTMKSQLDEMHENKVKIKFIGDIFKLPDNLQKIIEDAQLKTQNNDGVNLQIAFNYGSRSEIVNAVKKIVEEKISVEKISEELISDKLYTSKIPDPDLLIRTGDEKRVSNFLLWQIAYSEIVVVKDFWPEFNRQSLIDCILEFQKRKRRFGK